MFPWDGKCSEDVEGALLGLLSPFCIYIFLETKPATR